MTHTDTRVTDPREGSPSETVQLKQVWRNEKLVGRSSKGEGTSPPPFNRNELLGIVLHITTD